MPSMKCTAPKDSMEKDFYSTCLKRAKESKMDYFLEDQLRDVNDNFLKEDWFEVEASSSINAALNVLGTNLNIPPFTPLPPQPFQFSCIYCF